MLIREIGAEAAGDTAVTVEEGMEAEMVEGDSAIEIGEIEVGGLEMGEAMVREDMIADAVPHEVVDLLRPLREEGLRLPGAETTADPGAGMIDDAGRTAQGVTTTVVIEDRRHTHLAHVPSPGTLGLRGAAEGADLRRLHDLDRIEAAAKVHHLRVREMIERWKMEDMCCSIHRLNTSFLRCSQISKITNYRLANLCFIQQFQYQFTDNAQYGRIQDTII